jgi:transposase
MIGYDGFKHRKGTKVHVAVDEEAKPIALTLSPGNTHDSKASNGLYDKVNPKPVRLYADSADGVEAEIPINPRNGRREIPYDVKGYRRIRSAVERFNAWLKTFRRAIIRYERLALMFKAIITFTFIMIHMRYGP